MARQRSDSSSGIAAFDIGSNTVRGILAEPADAGALRILAAKQRMTALGRGLSSTTTLDLDGLEGTVAFVAETMRSWRSPPRAWAVATAAARNADNAEELLSRLRTAAGIDAQVITGEQEARLAWLGALSADPELGDLNPVVVDIGGRSTEVVFERDGALHAESRYVGARSLTEIVDLGREPDPLRELRGRIIAIPLLLDVMPLVRGGGVVVAIGGTAQAASRLLGKRRIGYDELSALEEELARLSADERRRRMPFDPERAEIICAGLLILSIFAHEAPDRHVVVSEGGVREGLLLDRTGAARLEWPNECFA